MTCPTCHNPKWVAAPRGGAASSFIKRLFSLFSRSEDAKSMRMCVYCRTVYPAPGSNDDDEDAIAERISRLQEQVSSMEWSPVTTPLEEVGTNLADAVLCLGCGRHFSNSDPQCGACGWKSLSPLGQQAQSTT